MELGLDDLNDSQIEEWVQRIKVRRRIAVDSVSPSTEIRFYDALLELFTTRTSS